MTISPTPATLTGPSNNAQLNTLTPTLSASAGSPQNYPINYHYYVCTSLGAAQQVIATNPNSITGCSRFDGGSSLTIPWAYRLSTNTQYWWAVLVDDTIDYNLQSPTIWSFKAGIPPVAFAGNFTPPTPTAPGSQPVTITNDTSTTWDTSYAVSYHVYSADGTTVVVQQGHQTALPSSVAPGASLTMPAALDPIAAGTYTIYWDMQKLPSTWFSGPPYYMPMTQTGNAFTSVAPPIINSTAPATGATPPSLTPTLSANATDPQGYALTYQFRLCTSADFTDTACSDSGPITPSAWTVPRNTLSWGATYYWKVTVRNSSATTISAISSITPSLPVVQPAWSFGWDPFASFSAGVNTALGNYVTSAADLKISTIGPSLEMTRTFNSMDAHTGWFGKGWTSTYETWIETSTDGYANATVHYLDGRLEFHSNNQDGSFADAIGFTGHLTGSLSGGYTLTSPDHSRLTFAASTGRLTSSQDANGRVITLTYSSTAPSQLVTVSDNTSGRAIHLSWANGQPASITSDAPAAGVAPLTVYYNYTSGELSSVCDPRSASATDAGYCTSFSYTAGQLTRMTRPMGNVGLALSYDTSGRVATLADGMTPANKWTYAYAASAVSGETKQTTVTDPRGNTTVSGYNSLNQLVRHVDEEGYVRTYGFDGRGLVNLIKDENGNSSIFNHDPRGNISSQVDAANHTTYFDYYLNTTDSTDLRNDRLVAVRDARSSSATDPTYKTTFDYDPLGNTIRQTGPSTADVAAGSVTNWSYSDGTAAYPAYGGGNIPAGLRVQEQDARGYLTKYAYDAKGDLRQITDRAGLVTTYNYDNLGRRVSQMVAASGFPSGLTSSYTYDGLGNVTSATEAGVVNAVTGVTHTRVTTMSYDPNSNLTSAVVSDSTGGDLSRTTSYTYDADDRPHTVANAESGTVTTYYDQLGNATRVIDPAGHETNTSFTPRNLPATITIKGFVDNPVTGTTPRDVVIARYVYDAAGRRTSATDALGRQTTYSWTADNRIKQASLINYHNLDGTVRAVNLGSMVYDAAGHLVTMTTGAAGFGINTRSFTYDAAGHLKTSTEDPGGLNRVSTLTYDPTGDVLSSLLSDGTTTESISYQYDSSGHIVQRSIANGASPSTTSYAYDNRGLKTASVDPRGNVTGGTPSAYETDFSYDANGRLSQAMAPPVSVESGGGAPSQLRPTTAYGYDAFDNQTQVKDPTGTISTAVYDRLSRQTSRTFPTYITPATQSSAGGAAVTPTESWSYDAIGNIQRHTGLRGQATDFVYDARNRVVQQTDPLLAGQTARGTATFTYDDAGNRLSSVDQLGARREATYDDLSRQRTTTIVVRGSTTARYTTTYDYNDLSNPVAATSPLGESNANVFDNSGQMTQSTDGNGIVTSFTYDLAGRLRRTTDGLNRATENLYDLAGRLIAVKNYDHAGALLTQSQIGYDPAGNAISLASPNAVIGGYATTRTYDALSRLTAMTEPVSNTASITTSFGYDAAGNQTRLTDGNGNATVKTYNSLGLQESTVEPATPTHPAATDRTFTTTYDAGGLPVTDNLPGVTISRSFDALGRLTQEAGSGTGITTATRTLGWDLAGRLTSASHPSGTISLTRDDRGLITAASSPSDSSSFTYDAVARLTSRVDAAGTSSFTYFGDGLVKTASDPLTGVTQTFKYDAAGQLSSVTTGTAGSTRSFTYDDLGRRTADVLGDPANPGAATHTSSYAYDANSNLTSMAVGPPALANGAATNYAYSYDHADRLASWTDQSANITTTYGWDGAGNRTAVGSATATFDQRNRLMTDTSGTAYAWDARGTLSKTTPSAGAATAYSFDGLNQLVSDATNTTYAYDGLGRLTSRNQASQLTTLKYSGTGTQPVSDGRYTFSRMPSGALLGMTNGTTRRLAGVNLHTDLTYTYNSNGAIVDAASYDPFGSPRAAFTSGGPTLGYQGAWGSDGSLNMGTRWYGPATGSFLSRDAASGSTQTASDGNRYLFAGSNPINRTDPTGQWWGWNTYITTTCLFGGPICWQGTERKYEWTKDWEGQPEWCKWAWSWACVDWPLPQPAPPAPVDPKPPVNPPSPPPTSGGGQSTGGSSGGTSGVGPPHPGPPNPGPADSNRSSYDPNWQGHVAPYPSGQAPAAGGLPPATNGPSGSPSVSVNENISQNPSNGTEAPSCASCTQLHAPPRHSSSGGSGIGQQAGEFLKGLGGGLLDLGKGAVGLVKLGAQCGTRLTGIDLFGCDKTLKAMGSYIWNHPTDVLGQMVDWEDWSHGRYARAVGHVLPSVVLTIGTFGAGGPAAKTAEVIGVAERGTDITSILSEHVAAGSARFAEQGFTRGQIAALERNPGLQAAFKGERIDTFAKESARLDPRLDGIKITGRFKPGADFIDPETGNWWDITTEGQWDAHVAKYGPRGTRLPY